MTKPITVMHPNAALQLTRLTSALLRVGLVTKRSVVPHPMFTPRYHAAMGTLRGGRRA